MTSAYPKRTPDSPHIEPLPALPERIRRRRPSLKRWAVLFLAATLTLGAGATWLFAPTEQDRLSTAEIAQRAAAFAATPPLQLKVVPAAELDARLADMQLSPAAQLELKQVLQQSQPAPSHAKPPPAGTPLPTPATIPATSSQLRLVELTLWDSQAPDGDVVRVVSAGYSRDVVLHKQPVVLAVPVQGSMPIQIVGVRDGGGGITLGVQGLQSPVMAPIISEGQTITLPIAP
jgi:hypothetical protein